MRIVACFFGIFSIKTWSKILASYKAIKNNKKVIFKVDETGQRTYIKHIPLYLISAHLVTWI